MQLSLLIPTYGRPRDLQRVLDSIYSQLVAPDEVVVVVGPGDTDSRAVADSWQAKWPIVRVLAATKKSVIHAMNLGFSVAKGDIIGLLDDDVWIPATYVANVKNAFETDPGLGAYGGRDHLQLDEPWLANPAPARLVGTFLWYGRFEGNHHCGAQQSPMLVDSLKGVNLSFRRAAFSIMQIEPALEGQGAEVSWETDICQQVILAGYNVVYDNTNYVLHYASPRLESKDNRINVFASAVPARMFNDALIMAKFRPSIEVVTSILTTFLLGARTMPGIVWSLLLLPKFGPKVLGLPWRNARFIWQGTRRGYQLRGKVALRNDKPIRIKPLELAAPINKPAN